VKGEVGRGRELHNSDLLGVENKLFSGQRGLLLA